MFSILIAAVIGLIEGGASGALGAFLGWSSSGDPFVARKFVTGIVTGTVAGVLFAFGNLLAFKGVTDELALLAIYGDIFAGGLMATLGVPKISGAITTRISGDTTTPS